MTAQTGNQGTGFAGIEKKHLRVGVAVILLFLLLGYLGFRLAFNDALATLSKFDGDTDRDVAAEQETWFEAFEGDDFRAGDGARTEEKSTAYFRLGGGAQLTLRPASQIRFQAGKGGRGAIGLQVEVGEADVQTKDGQVTLDSQFGPIVISQNSTVNLRRDGARMLVDVELGSIELGQDGRRVVAGEVIELEIGGLVVEEPEAPAPKPEEPEEEPEEEEDALDVGDGVSSVDLVVTAGQSFTVHDPTPPTAIGFRFSELCDGPAQVSSGKLSTQAESQGNLPFPKGSHKYQVSCLSEPDKVVAEGRFRILRDSGTRQLPAFTPSANVSTDGRRYTVMYQQKLPQVTVTWASAPKASSYTLKVGGRRIKTSSPSYTFRSGTLSGGTHSLIFSAASEPPRQSRSTTVAVVYDTQAPAARVSEPRSGFADGSEVKVAGQALPGWSVSVGGKELEVDSQRRFSTELQASGALPIAFSHPKHGMHYYLRRPQASSSP